MLPGGTNFAPFSKFSTGTYLISRLIFCGLKILTFAIIFFCWLVSKLMCECLGDQICNFSHIAFHQCSENETCVKVNAEAFCRCKPGYERSSGGSCLQAHPEPNPTPAPNTSTPSESGGFGEKPRPTFFMLLHTR